MHRRAAVRTTILLFFLPAGALANPVLVTPTMYGMWPFPYPMRYIFLVAVASLLCEYLLLRFLFEPHAKFRRTLAAFCFVHLISFPFTQLLGLAFAFAAELFPLIIEPILFTKRFAKRQIRVPHLTIKVVAANLISFGIGLLGTEILRQYFSRMSQ